MKKQLFFLLLICASIPLGAYPTHTPQLKAPIQNLYRLQETKQLLDEVEKQGPITIRNAAMGAQASNAAWVPSERAIYINFSKQRTPGSLITSIVFELHNALSVKQFDYYDHLARTRKISKAQYIEAIERIEYVNARSASHILAQGVRKGVFPQDAFWYIPNNFEQHFKIQLQSGHSAHIGQMYDSIIQSSSYALARR
jgi:hypothetical protein